MADLDLELVLDRLLDTARELTGARYAALGVLNPERTELERFVALGVDADGRSAIGHPPRGRGVLGELIHDPRPLRLADVGAHPHAYGFPPSHPPMTTFLGVPVLIRGEAWGNLYLTDKERGAQFDAADEEAAGVLADWAATAIANARLYQGERGQRAELERAVRAFETTSSISQALAGEMRLERILELVVKRGRAVVGARTMAIALRAGDELVIRAAAGAVEPDVVGRRVALERTMMGEVLRTGRAHRLGEPATPIRATLAERLGARSGLMVPVQFRGGALGVLAAFDRGPEGDDFGDEDEDLMTALAASAATAVATAQHVAAEGVRRGLEASERERARWARELNDGTLQELAALKLTLATALRIPEREAVDAALRQAIERVEHGVRSLRDLMADLRPGTLDELGLVPALEGLAARLAAGSRLRIAVAAELEGRLRPDTEAALYRVAQEAMSNALAHAGATRIDVALGTAGERVELAVRDDGVGFDPEGETDGYGVLGMLQRVELLGGTLEVRSVAGEGTEVRALVPLARDGEAARRSA